MSDVTEITHKNLKSSILVEPSDRVSESTIEPETEGQEVKQAKGDLDLQKKVAYLGDENNNETGSEITQVLDENDKKSVEAKIEGVEEGKEAQKNGEKEIETENETKTQTKTKIDQNSSTQNNFQEMGQGDCVAKAIIPEQKLENIIHQDTPQKPLDVIPEETDLKVMSKVSPSGSAGSSEYNRRVGRQPITGLESPTPEIEYKKHPLQTEWTLWFMDGDKRKQQDSKWGSNLIKIYTIKFVEDWWLLYSYILLPSKLRVKNDYMLFRGEIEPKWEDVKNKDGGKWQLVLPNKFRNDKLDAMWLTTVLSMIGETYGDLGEYVNGAYLQRRQKEDRISLWTSSADKKDEEETTTIGKVLKHTLNLSEKSQLHYLKHEDVNSANGKGPNQSWGRRNQDNNRLYHV